MVKTSSFLLSCALIEDIILIAMVFWEERGPLGYFLQVLQRENVFDLC